jgi:hypothetical protein
MTNSLIPKPPVPLKTLVAGLGWFSIGLGLAELIAPRQVSRAAGMAKKDAQDALVRGYGLREIGTGLGILLSRNPRPWLWGRVAGDVLDVATVAATADTRQQGRLGASFGALLGVGLLDLYCAAQSLPQQARRNPAGQSARDYSGRSGFRASAAQMRGAALTRGETAQPATSLHGRSH